VEAAQDDCALYDEYVRGFDDVPTLTDPVALPPPRLAPPDFRFGERKDVRRHARQDAVTIREQCSRELEAMYAEYVEPGVPAAKGRKSATRKRKRQRRKK
jgi:hypothetical protein